MSKIRVRLEFEIETDLNVSQVRGRLGGLLMSDHPVVQGLRQVGSVRADAMCGLTAFTASYATRYGRKPTDEDEARNLAAAKGIASIHDQYITAQASAHAPDDIDSVRASGRFVD